MPLWPLVRPIAILKDFFWLCQRFFLQRPIALGPGLQSKKVSAPLFAARWAPEANLCGAFAFGLVFWCAFHILFNLLHRFNCSKIELTFYWRIHCDDMGGAHQSAALVPNILHSNLSKSVAQMNVVFRSLSQRFSQEEYCHVNEARKP